METTERELWEKEILAQLTAWKAAAADHGIPEPKYLYLVTQTAQNIFIEGKQRLLDEYVMALIGYGHGSVGIYDAAEEIWKDREAYRAKTLKDTVSVT